MIDVAKAAGVSHQTVFRVLNDQPGVKASTRLRVLAAIEQLGYRRNNTARTLVTGKSQVIGVLTINSALYGPTSMLAAVERAAYREGYFPSVATLATTERAEVLVAIDRLVSQGVDGLVVIVPVAPLPRIVADIPSDLPVVAVEGVEGSDVDIVTVDQVTGASAATAHLLELGHETVWHVAGPPDWLEADRRAAGWRTTLEAHAIEPPPSLTGDWSARSGFEAGQMLARIEGMRAVFAANDSMALGVLRALHEGGLAVPTDVSVVGFDDVPEARFYNPPLTTVRQPFQRVGQESVRLLLRQLADGRRGNQRRVVEPELVARHSTAAPGQERMANGNLVRGGKKR